MKKKQESQSSDEEVDSEDLQNKKIYNKPKIDRILPDILKQKKIIINVSMTQYPVITQVAQQFRWLIQTDKQAGDWDVFWTDFSIEPDTLIRMHLHQKINYYPGIHVIARKNLLGINLMNLRNKFPQQYNFFPLTWMLPTQYSQFRKYYQNIPKGKVRTFIVKPEAQCQGRGIFLTRNIQDLQNGSHYVIQKYINKPYLIDGLKFDFRIYVLLCGTDPLRVYLYQEGLVRFATEAYNQPNSSNIDQPFIHLTNYAINKINPKFIFNKGVNDMSSGHKRSLTSVYKLLQKKGQNVSLIKQKIKDIIIKTLLTSNPLISHQYKHSQPQQYYGNICFHILGFDILLTEQLEPMLLQVNHTPSFTTDTPLDHFIKRSLIKDTLTLMNINSKTKSTLYKKAIIINSQRLLNGKRQIYQGQTKQKQIDQAQLERDEYQRKNLGRYERIYPTQNQQRMKKYKQIYDIALKNFMQQNQQQKKLQKLQAKKMLREQRLMFNLKNKVFQQDKIKKKNSDLIKKRNKSQKKLQVVKSNESLIVKRKKKKKVGGKKHYQNRQKGKQLIQVSNLKKKQSFLNEINTYEMTKINRQNIKQLSNNPPTNKYFVNNQKYARYKVQLPQINSDYQKQRYIGEQDITIQKKKISQQQQKKSYIYKKGQQHSSSLLQKNQKYYDQKNKVNKLIKLQQQASINIKNLSSTKNGNFIMPKIFDINVQQKSILPLNIKNTFLTKYLNDQ